MKILVVGGTRYAGVHLVRALLSREHEVTIANRGKTLDAFGESVKRKIIERRDAESLQNAFKGEFYDAVIDNVAYASNDVKGILEAVQTDRYIMTSTISVYRDFHENMLESDFDPKSIGLKWLGWDGGTYDEIKRQAEAALFQAYPGVNSVAVRFPWIFGTDDYTERLYFYMEKVLSGKPIYVDNRNSRLSLVNSEEAGEFLAWCAESGISGAVNACSDGTVSMGEVMDYAETRSGKKAVFADGGEPAPLNGIKSLRLNTDKAKADGFKFKRIDDWIYPAVDYWLDGVK